MQHAFSFCTFLSPHFIAGCKEASSQINIITVYSFKKKKKKNIIIKHREEIKNMPVISQIEDFIIAPRTMPVPVDAEPTSTDATSHDGFIRLPQNRLLG